MSEPNNILGKIGKKVGEELKAFRSTSDNTYATKVSLGNLDGQVSINSSAIVSLGQAIVSLGNTSGQDYVTKVSLNNYKTGVNIFNDLSATRASIGDLTVTGTTTTLNTQTVVIEDNIIEVNLKSDGTESAQTGGIQVNRGLGSSGLPTATFTPGTTEFKVECEPELLNTGSAGQADSVIFHAFDSNVVQTYRGRYFRDLTYGTIHYYPLTNFPKWQDLFSSGGTVSPDVYEIPSDLSLYVALTQVTDTKGFKLTSVSSNTTDAFPTSGQLQVSFVTETVNGDKATIIWDNNTGQSMFKFGLGSSDADIKVKDVNASGVVSVASGTNLTINSVAIGDYSEFTAGLTLGKS